MTWAAYPVSRDSRVQWLGALPEHWKVRNPKTLFVRHREPAHEGDRQLTASQADGVVYQDEFVEGRGARVVQVIEGQAGLKHVSAGDFVISLRSFQGGIEFSAVSGKISPAYTVLSPRPEAHKPYFTYLLKSQGFIQELRSTSNQLRDGQSLGMEHFAQVVVPLPPPDEQAAIAQMLDVETAKIDALIAKQEQLIATLREDRTATITHAVTKGLDAEIGMRDSGVPWIGQIPVNWTLGKLKHGFSVVLGKMYQGEQQNPSDELLPHLKAGSLNESFELDLDDPMLCWFTPEEVRKLSVRKNDLLVVEGGATYGRCVVVREDLPGWGFQKSLNRVRPRGDDSIHFLAYLIRSATEIGHVSILCGKATIPHLTTEKLEALEWPHPSPAEQQAIVDFLDERCAAIDALISKALEVIETLREFRTALITDAVTGKIDVRGAVA